MTINTCPNCGIVDVVFTVSVAALLVTFPATLLTTTTDCAPLSADVVAGGAQRAEVAPVMAVPVFCHWYLTGAVPVATTVKVAVGPTVKASLAGWVVIE